MKSKEGEGPLDDLSLAKDPVILGSKIDRDKNQSEIKVRMNSSMGEAEETQRVYPKHVVEGNS